MSLFHKMFHVPEPERTFFPAQSETKNIKWLVLQKWVADVESGLNPIWVDFFLNLTCVCRVPP